MALSETPAQVTTEGRPASPIRRAVDALRGVLAPVRTRLAILEVDTRLLGMVVALLVIWFGFNFASDLSDGVLNGNGTFLTARNLWNLSVQSASIAIMATGMVLIIVSRNIDLSVGSMLAFIGYTMAMLQSQWIPQVFGAEPQPWIWIVTVLVGMLLGAVIGGVQGFFVAYGGVPSFIVTLGGLLIWRGLIFRYAQGQTIAPLDQTFQMLGGGTVGTRVGALGDVGSWVLGGLACLAIIASLVFARRRKRRYGFPTRPLWAEVAVAAVSSIVALGAVFVANSYLLPTNVAQAVAAEKGIPVPPGGFATGVAIPVLVLIVVGIAVTFLATRRQFGRYVYAIGGNPDAAALGGINVRWTILKTFALMGILCGISASVATARLNSAVTNLGIQNELDVISAAVIGGTSFAGGIGTIPGAILGAVVMQSLRSGMSLLLVDSPTQDIVVGIVLVGAVFLDTLIRRRAG
ncbi:MAG TPA: sugar ABC transporter permease [Candidatus Limnocylindrales bacterium]|nr:sugar ABC transporter permease [Candidatus Limnocylindrales bacterium]